MLLRALALRAGTRARGQPAGSWAKARSAPSSSSGARARRRSATTFHGALADDRRDTILGEASVFAMPSRVETGGAGEGFRIAFVEAGALGPPVVTGRRRPRAGRRGSRRRTLGLLVDPGSREIAPGELMRQPSRERADRWAAPARTMPRSLRGRRRQPASRQCSPRSPTRWRLLCVEITTSQMSGAERSRCADTRWLVSMPSSFQRARPVV